MTHPSSQFWFCFRITNSYGMKANFRVARDPGAIGTEPVDDLATSGPSGLLLVAYY
jgi:hypothetical protein